MDDNRAEEGRSNAIGGGGIGGGVGGGNVIGTPKKLTEKARSLSDGGGTQLSPSPHIVEATRRTSKDDSTLHGNNRDRDVEPPVTPHRPDFAARANGLNLSLQMPRRDSTPPSVAPTAVPTTSASATNHHLKHTLTPTPLSPKLDHSQIYASPTNILPRRSRGLDFSRAATSLHHSTLAEQSSPDSSPTIGGRGMNIPGRGSVEYGAEQSSNSLWSMMGAREKRNHLSGSVGSTNNMIGSDSSSSSGEDDYMDDEMEDAIMNTPQAARSNSQSNSQASTMVPWLPDTSPAVSSLSSFRTRPRKQPRKKLRGLLGLGFKPTSSAALSKSPPSNAAKDAALSHPRRESISWAANQLHISGSDPEERGMDAVDPLTTPSKDGQRGVVKRAVTRRGNLLVCANALIVAMITNL